MMQVRPIEMAFSNSKMRKISFLAKMFGQNKTFGSSSFGANTSTGSGLFGQQNNQNKSIFGQSTPAAGTSTLFGAAAKPANSLFGGNTAASTGGSGLFGSPQTQNQSSSLFGGSSTTANRPLFGGATNTSSGGLFGSSNNNNNAQSSSIFGNSNSSGGSLFGGNSGVSGTTVKFEPPISSDTMMRNGSTQTISTKHMCITAMTKYEGKSVDELRVEDYMANRKAPGAGATSGGGLFGGNATSTASTGGGLFGNNNQQHKSTMFGGSTSTFGNSANTSGSLFGNNNASTSASGSTSLFGAKPATSSLFGGATTTTQSTFGNTSNTGGSLFGGATQNTGGSLFGQNQNQNNQSTGGSLFGNTGNTGGGLFGNTQQQQQPQQSTGFNFGGGAATTNTFGQPAASTGGSLFGNTATTNTGGSLFGAKPATSTGFNFGGQQATTTNAFGSTNTTGGGGLFGNNAAKPGGLFGNTTTTTTGGGLFGAQQPAGGGLFGSQPVQQPAQQVVVQPQVAPIPVIGVTADVLQMQANMKSLQSQLTNAPYGDSPLLKYNTTQEEAKDSPASTQRQLRFLAAKNGANGSESSFITAPITKVMSDLSPAVNKEVSKDLNYTSKEAPPTLGRGLRNGNYNPNQSIGGSNTNKNNSVLDASLNSSSNRLRGSVRKSNLKQLDLSVLADTSRMGSASRDTSRIADPDALPRISEAPNVQNTPQIDPVQAVQQRRQDRNKEPPALNLDTTCDELEPISSASSAASVVVPNEPVHNQNQACGVRLSKPDYYTLPTINEMKQMVRNGKVVLEEGLTVGRSSYGSVFWPGRVELKDVVLDEVVIFRHKEVTVYPNDEEKPEEGQELNRPAEVTLERIWYTDKKTKKEVRDVVKLAEIGWRDHLERLTVRMGAEFKDFRAETGSWVFRVDHFSKYGLADDDEPMDVAPPTSAPAPLQAVDLNTSLRDVNSQVQRKKVYMSPKPRETVLERVPAAEQLSHGPIQITRRLNGLGGGRNDEDQMIADMTVEFNDELHHQLEHGEQPEKKPKLEVLVDLEYESSRFIRNLQDLKVMPKSVEPKVRFNGGSVEHQMIGAGKSKRIDLGVAKGRSSRVGWSETGCLVWSAQPLHNQVLFGMLDRSSDVSSNVLTAMLDVNVNICESSRKGPSHSSGSSSFVTYSDSYREMFDKYVEIATANGNESHASVWKLLTGLFPSNRQEGWSFERGERIGEWLREQATEHGSPSNTAWSFLCVGDVDGAFQKAMSTGNSQLASMLHTSSVCPEATVHCFKAQLENWKEHDVLHLVPKEVLKCYVLMSGASFFQWESHGKKHVVNCLEGLHWTQALGMHVWYLRNWNGLEEAYSAYQNDVNAGRAASNRGDLFGELIKLACESQHSMEVVLDCAETQRPHDHFLQWHVWSVLFSVGYRTMSKTVETRLHRSFSAQLEAAKLSKYSVFVLQHIEDDEERATAVRSLLDRIARFTDNDQFDSISEQLDVPSEWIAEAQFSVAKCVDDATQLFELAVAAKNVLEMRRVFVGEIAPTAVVTGDTETLKTACLMMRPFEAQIPEWGATGMVYMDYCRMIDLLENEADEEALKEVLDSLEMRLHAPTVDKDNVQKLALQTIGRHLFEYRSDRSTLPEWTRLLGHRQLFKIFRDRSSWAVERFTVDFE